MNTGNVLSSDDVQNGGMDDGFPESMTLEDFEEAERLFNKAWEAGTGAAGWEQTEVERMSVGASLKGSLMGRDESVGGEGEREKESREGGSGSGSGRMWIEERDKDR